MPFGNPIAFMVGSTRSGCHFLCVVPRAMAPLAVAVVVIVVPVVVPGLRRCQAARASATGSAAAACRASPSRAARRACGSRARSRAPGWRAACRGPSCCRGSSLTRRPPEPPSSDRCRRRASSSAGSSGARCSGSGMSRFGVGADPRHRHLQREHFGAAEGLDDLRAGVRSSCSGRECRALGRSRTLSAASPTTAGLRSPSGRARARRRAGPSASCSPRAGRRSAARRRRARCGPRSSSFMPRWMKWRVKLPDCEEPRMIAQRMLPASGFGVPKSSCARVAEERLHVAERRGADAEHVRVLHPVHELIELGRIEAALQAHLHRQRGRPAAARRRCRRRSTSSRRWGPFRRR